MIDVPQLYADDAGNTYVVVIFQWEIYLGLPPEKKKNVSLLLLVLAIPLEYSFRKSALINRSNQLK